MKKICFILFAIITLSSCNVSVSNNLNSKIKIGVIETTGNKDKSYIHFYDENLNFLYKEENNFSSLSEPFDSPVYRDGIVFMIPKGNFKTRDEKSILGYDINKDTYTIYNTDLYSMNRLAESEKYLFGVNTINGNSKIVRCSKEKSEKNLYNEFEDIYIKELVAIEGTLFATMKREETELLAEISIETLKVLNSYDITKYGSPSSIIKYGNCLYLANQWDNFITGELSNKLTVFNMETEEFSQLELVEYAPNDLVIINNLLFVSNYNRVQCEGNNITVVNLENNNVDTYDLGHHVEKILTDGTYIYILSDDCIYKYIYNNSTFKEINQVKISMDRTDNTFYISSFFVTN